MTETTIEERDALRQKADNRDNRDWTHTTVDCRWAFDLLNDADRLAELEQAVRELANSHQRMGSHMTAEELRALLDEEE